MVPGQQPVRVVFALLHIRFVEGVDAKQEPRGTHREFPEQKERAEVGFAGQANFDVRAPARFHLKGEL
jgi:hypothetical protein